MNFLQPMIKRKKKKKKIKMKMLIYMGINQKKKILVIKHYTYSVISLHVNFIKKKEELNESKLKEVENNEYKEKEEPSNDKLKDNENGELEEKKEDQKDNDELKEKEELKDNYELKEKEEQKDNGEFGEVRENKEEIAKENENINNDEKNISKTKLLQYREYTEEEQRKINKDDDEFESIDYDNI